MRRIIKTLLIIIPVGIFLQSCHKDKKTDTDPVTETPIVTPVASTGNMKMIFNNQVDGDALVLGKNYVNENGETYSLSKFNYYISNIVLTKDDNTNSTIDLYQIINQSDDTSKTMVLKGIPEGSYKSIKLMLGVDSLSNVSGAKTGGLDIAYAHDMYWGWSQGYITLKLEGKSSVSPDGNVTYHIGGFGGPYKTQREFAFDLATPLTITKNSVPQLDLLVNVNEIFKKPTTLSFTKDNAATSPGSKQTVMIANNYADMIKFGSLKN